MAYGSPSYDCDLQFSDLRYQIRNKRTASGSDEDYPPAKRRQNMDWISVERPNDRSTSVRGNKYRGPGNEPFEVGGQWFQSRVHGHDDDGERRNTYFDEMSGHRNDNQERRDFQSSDDFERHTGESVNRGVGRDFIENRYSPIRHASRNRSILDMEDFQGNNNANRSHQEDRRNDDSRYHRERNTDVHLRANRKDAEEYQRGADNHNFANNDFQNRNEGTSNMLLGRRQEFQSHGRQNQGRNNVVRKDAGSYRKDTGNNVPRVRIEGGREPYRDETFQAGRAQDIAQHNVNYRSDFFFKDQRKRNLEWRKMVRNKAIAKSQAQGNSKGIGGNLPPFKLEKRVRKYRWLKAWCRIEDPKELVHLMSDAQYGFFEMLEEDYWLAHDKVIMTVQVMRTMCAAQHSPMKQELLQQFCESKNFLDKMSRHMALYYMDKIEERRPVALMFFDNLLAICVVLIRRLPKGAFAFLAVILQAMVGAMSNMSEFHNTIISKEMMQKASDLTLQLIETKVKNRKT